MRTLALVILVAHVALAAQGPTFRASTRLVQVSVVVEGRDGQPVAGLTANDFKLFDGRQEQRIELFLSDSSPVRAGTLPAPVAVADAPGQRAQYTNRMATRRNATVLLIDRLNTPANDQLYARRHLVSFLQQIRSEDRIGLYVLEPDRVRVLHDFTNDAGVLVRAMSRYRAMTSNEALDSPLPEFEPTGDAALDAELAAFLERANANIAAHFTGLRAEATLAAFVAIANHLAAVEGRKTLIWVTSGFPLQAFADRGKNTSAAIHQLIRPLNDANVTLYAVDARGLMGGLTFGPGATTSFTTLSSVQTNLDVLQIAAIETGGRAFFNTNDINSAVRRAVDESRITYTLGYYPAHGKWDGAYRQIKVQVNRPGVQLRHRKGYLATAASQRVSGATAIRAALMSPLEAVGLELAARVEREAAVPDDVKVVVSIAPAVIAFEPAGDMWKGTLDIVIAQKLADGTMSKTVDQRFDLSLRRDRYEEARAVGFTIDKTLTLLPGVQSLYVVVHDVLSGTTGSIIIPPR